MMSRPLSIGYAVKVIKITALGDKIRFNLRHPENAECLTGIAVTCTRSRPQGLEGALLSDVAGTLALAIPEKGDVFFAESVKAEQGDFRDLTERRINLGLFNYPFGFSVKRIEYYDVSVPATNTLMEGYYEDSATEAGLIIIIGDDAPPELYKVTLYLRYQMKS
jgi:hypothetical protein